MTSNESLFTKEALNINMGLFKNRPSFLLAVNSMSVILLKVDDYDNLLKFKDTFEMVCKKHGMRVEIVEVDRSEINSLANDARQLEIRFKELMQKSDGGASSNDDSENTD